MANVKTKGKRLHLDEYGLTIGEREVIEALINGNHCAETSRNVVFRTTATVTWRLNCAKKRHGCQTKEQLIYKLAKQGAI